MKRDEEQMNHDIIYITMVLTFLPIDFSVLEIWAVDDLKCV